LLEVGPLAAGCGRELFFYSSMMDEKNLWDMHDPYTVLYPPAGAHAMKIIASGAPSPADRRPCDAKHRIGRSFAAGPAPGACDA